ncbi:MAG TPA: response regulator, partial [Pyrinomonadaceae bacterium]|nr:response regulator [Pyrinomonadaceae bacterium]
MRVVIIEDEPPASEKLRDFVRHYEPGIQIAGTLESVKETFAWFHSNLPPDLIFSDIELLDGNIFDFFENTETTCPIIFTTAYNQFWLQAFERNGIAYLLKPLTFEKFAAAMKKFETLKQNFVSKPHDFWREMQESLKQPKY